MTQPRPTSQEERQFEPVTMVTLIKLEETPIEKETLKPCLQKTKLQIYTSEYIMAPNK